MKLVTVESSMIHAIGYDKESVFWKLFSTRAGRINISTYRPRRTTIS
jgi:hypothetical protein